MQVFGIDHRLRNGEGGAEQIFARVFFVVIGGHEVVVYLMPPIIPAVSGASEQTSAIHENKPRGRVLALDVGSKRIGMAVSDELRLLARGLETLQRKSKRADLERIWEIAKKLEVAEIVVGHPLRIGGESSAQTEKVIAFAEELRAQCGLPVRLWDERLTSVEAEALLDQEKRTVQRHIADRRSGAVDRIAAVLILQGYLDQKQ
jgi:putative Holliday junction resolvase